MLCHWGSNQGCLFMVYYPIVCSPQQQFCSQLFSGNLFLEVGWPSDERRPQDASSMYVLTEMTNSKTILTASLEYYNLCRNQKVYFFSGDFAGIFIFSSKNVLICCVCRWLTNVAMDLNGPTYYDGCKLSLDECSGRPV